MEEAPRPEPQNEYVPRPSSPGERPRRPRGMGGAMAAVVVALTVAAVLIVGVSRRSAPTRAPEPRPTPTAAEKLKQCRPYAQFAAALNSGAESDAELVADAKCLCSLAGSFLVHNVGAGLQPFVNVAACPSGSVPRPFEPDAKVWLGTWIDEPGHNACACYSGIHDTEMVVQRLRDTR